MNALGMLCRRFLQWAVHSAIAPCWWSMLVLGLPSGTAPARRDPSATAPRDGVMRALALLLLALAMPVLAGDLQPHCVCAHPCEVRRDDCGDGCAVCPKLALCKPSPDGCTDPAEEECREEKRRRLHERRESQRRWECEKHCARTYAGDEDIVGQVMCVRRCRP